MAMLDHEYRRKIHPENYSRNWTYTIICVVLFAIVGWGIVSAWRYLGHDPYTIGAVIIPASIVAIFLLLAAINGRKEVAKEAWAASLELLFWWRP